MEDTPEEEVSQEETEDTEDLQDPEMETEEETPDEDEPERKPVFVLNFYSWWIPIVGVLMLLIGLVGGYLLRPYIPSSQAAAPTLNPSEVSSLETQAPQPTMDPATRQQLMDFLLPQVTHFKGDENAPITLLEFSDFQCPYCGRFATQVEPEIIQQYVDQGKVRLGYWHVAFLGEESQWAAEAAECAGDQNAFWEYHDKLFSSQNGENQGAFNKDNLKQFAVDLNLDATKFDECLDSGTFSETVRTQTATANQLGVNSTPAFVINGYPVLGAQPFETFQQVIEGELSSMQ